MPESKKDKIQAVLAAARRVLDDATFQNMATMDQAIEDYDAAPEDSGCRAKYEGEPTFTLVGRDKLATWTISHWLYLAEQEGVERPGQRIDRTKFEDAYQVLEWFRRWQADNPDKVKLPD